LAPERRHAVIERYVEFNASSDAQFKKRPREIRVEQIAAGDADIGLCRNQTGPKRRQTR